MAQAGALWRKNAVYQRRNVGTNACLLCAPILFCLLLLVVQVAVTKLLLTGENYQVGLTATGCLDSCIHGMFHLPLQREAVLGAVLATSGMVAILCSRVMTAWLWCAVSGGQCFGSLTFSTCFAYRGHHLLRRCCIAVWLPVHQVLLQG